MIGPRGPTVREFCVTHGAASLIGQFLAFFAGVWTGAGDGAQDAAPFGTARRCSCRWRTRQAQRKADFGQAQAIVAGVECTAYYLAIDLPQLEDILVMACPAETTEAFLEGFDRNENTVCSMAHRISGQTMHIRTTLNTINELGRNHIFLPLVFPIL
jgi:hypothetical protein